MKNISLLITLFAFTLTFSCSAVVPDADDPAQPKPAPWVWPMPPEQPRVQFIKTFITPQDLGITRGFFAKLWEFIAGEDTVDRIVSPYGIVENDEDKVYVVDWGAAVIHYFDFKKKKYDQFGKTREGPLASPIGAALDADGLLYVSDSQLRRVFVYKGTKNKRIIGDDSLLRPTGVAIDKIQKVLYVVDTIGHRVDVFDLTGKKLRTIGSRGEKNGEFNYPTHITVDAAGDVYVMDTLNFRVQIFDKDGKFLTQFGSNGTAIGDFMKPKGIAVDSEGHIWIADGLRNTIQVFNREGRLLLIFGKVGIGPGEFNVPVGLYIDKKDRIFVGDSYNYRVQMLQYLKSEETGTGQIEGAKVGR